MTNGANASDVQSVRTFLLCPCGSQATIGYAFPGQPERGICDLHEKSVEMRRELSPGRAEVASVRRLDGRAPVQAPVQLVAETASTEPDATTRELNWTKSQLEDAKEHLADKDEELEILREQLAEARQALTAEQPSTVEGEQQT